MRCTRTFCAACLLYCRITYRENCMPITPGAAAAFRLFLLQKCSKKGSRTKAFLQGTKIKKQREGEKAAIRRKEAWKKVERETMANHEKEGRKKEKEEVSLSLRKLSCQFLSIALDLGTNECVLDFSRRARPPCVFSSPPNSPKGPPKNREGPGVN